MQAHWERFGRNVYSRHDYEAVDSTAANAMMDDLRAKLPSMAGTSLKGRTVEAASEFAYDDPVDGSRSEGQGIQIHLNGGGRIVYRLSGTGTEGATVRVYLEDRITDPAHLQDDPQQALAEIIAAADEAAELLARTGRSGPDVIT